LRFLRQAVAPEFKLSAQSSALRSVRKAAIAAIEWRSRILQKDV
jgi:hypothetical protein